MQLPQWLNAALGRATVTGDEKSHGGNSQTSQHPTRPLSMMRPRVKTHSTYLSPESGASGTRQMSESISSREPVSRIHNIFGGVVKAVSGSRGAVVLADRARSCPKLTAPPRPLAPLPCKRVLPSLPSSQKIRGYGHRFHYRRTPHCSKPSPEGIASTHHQDACGCIRYLVSKPCSTDSMIL